MNLKGWNKMKALTLWQPWASLLAYGAKKYETRSWATKYRGPIAIHAATRPVIEILRTLDQHTIDAMGMALSSRADGRYGANDLLGLPRGHIIATAELVGCYEMYESNSLVERTSICIKRDLSGIPISGNELLFGDWTPGRYAWEFANMTMLPEPIPAKGHQQLWNWEEHHENQ